jgi:acetolactate synthase regulatory subunit
MANTEGALERLLGRLRQRNFAVCGLNANTSANFARMELKVTVESAKPIELAIKQLNKLIDVEGVEIRSAEEHQMHHQHEIKPRQHVQHQDRKHIAAFEPHSPFQSFELTTSQIGL